MINVYLLLQEFYETVIKNADIIQATGDAVCVFPEVQCLTPRSVEYINDMSRVMRKPVFGVSEQV